MKSRITIGITDCSKYENYLKWIEKEAGTEVIRLSHLDNNFDDIARCHGILLTGGEDVHPRFYHKIEYLELCQEIDERRDEFELNVLAHAEKNQTPLLGICRGLQVANVYFGGTLLPHIPAFGKFDHSKNRSADRYHDVFVDPYSELKEIVTSPEGQVNSAHHQSADRIGKGLVPNALSPDGVVEGLERQDKEGHGFLLLVQWHPERMKDQESKFSKNIKEVFLQEIRKMK